MKYLETDAVISDCGLYRYALMRVWDEALARVTFVMLNPSTADHRADDPTIRKCVGFAQSWGFGSLAVVNLFALRATDPRELSAARSPIGPENDFYITAHTAGRTVVCAWGAAVAKSPRLILRARAGDVRRLLAADPDCAVRHLGLTRDGHPRHPLYLAANTQLQEFAQTKTRRAG